MMKTYKYDEAFTQSLEYFGGDELAANVFLSKYALKNEKDELIEATPTQMHWRIANEFARIEKTKFKDPYTAEQLFALFDKFKYIVPQGSPMFGIGNDYQTISLANCFLLESPADSYGGILKTDEQLVQISKRRGGVGIDLSHLRPAGATTHNAAKTSTGIGAFMERYSNSIREVGQSGRRGALMLTLDVTHPEAELFATIKNDPTKVTGANISLKLNDKFMRAVDADDEFTQQWPVDSKTPEIKRVIKAKDLWDKIIHSAWLRAEPGLLFWDNIRDYNAVDCYADEGFASKGTNPCSEIPLSEFDACRLMALNELSYVKNPFTPEAEFDYELFIEHTKIAQRLMDDLVDMELEKIAGIIKKIKADPESENVKDREIVLWQKIQDMCAKGRRTGLGITATGDTLAALGIKYGSKESVEFVGEVHKQMKLASFRSSMEMAKELGAFPIWNWDKEKDTSFLLNLKVEDPKLYKDISTYGRRNIANLTIAPTGTLSIMTQTSSGIEPVFQVHYIRRKKINPNDENTRTDYVDQNNDHWQNFDVYHSRVKMWMDITGETNITKSPWYGCCAEDIDWVQRVKLQAAAQKHIDHAISSTINLPEDVSEEKVAEIYLTAWDSFCKGITVYRKNCRSGVLIDTTKKPEPEVKGDEFSKRPVRLNCEIYHSKVKSQDYFVIVGLSETGQPYEVFCGKNGFLGREITEGGIHKVKRGHYQLVDNEGKVIVENISKHCEEDEEALGRMVSMALRHNAGIEYVVAQLGKVEGSMNSLSKAISRALKKHVKDGTKIKGVTCHCGSINVVFENGCNICKSCGSSKCS